MPAFLFSNAIGMPFCRRKRPHRGNGDERVLRPTVRLQANHSRNEASFCMLPP